MKKKTDLRSIGLDKLTVEHAGEIDVGDVLREAINKYGIKAILNKIGFICFNEGMPYVLTTLKFLATKREAELVEGMIILLYIRDHWNKLLANEAKNYFEKVFRRTKANEMVKQLKEVKNERES